MRRRCPNQRMARCRGRDDAVGSMRSRMLLAARNRHILPTFRSGCDLTPMHVHSIESRELLECIPNEIIRLPSIQSFYQAVSTFSIFLHQPIQLVYNCEILFQFIFFSKQSYYEMSCYVPFIIILNLKHAHKLCTNS